jgi:hypothetical protein
MSTKIWDACPVHGNIPRPSLCADCARAWGDHPSVIPAPDWRDRGRYVRTERPKGLGLEVVFEDRPVAPPPTLGQPWNVQGASIRPTSTTRSGDGATGSNKAKGAA